ncbi:MAG TPA: class I SAM-dependent methyltransferase [Sphingomicrobium sp.]|nr:class I SAM-dependent methyltransferase [Sphingomicrobium sp.]
MEAWYEELLSDEGCEHQFLRDYEPHREFLESLRGDVLDIGGGAGVAGRFLDSGVSYTIVEPLDFWRSPRWLEFGRRFRLTGPEPRFVKAGGEALPIAAESFDAALAFWSLNHAADAARCMSEIIRVLRSGGVARIVLEDMEPRWADLIGDIPPRLVGRFAKVGRPASIQMRFADALKMKLTGDWPLQEDHIRIREADLLRVARARLRLVRRQWLGGWLTLDFVKRIGIE